MKNYSSLIIDDDIENINLLKIYLKKYFPMINLTSEATGVQEGILEFLRIKPDLLFLDIELGSDNIFSFLDNIDKNNSEIILISSHSKYGVKAVNYNVSGYLLKPIIIDELKKTTNKALYNIEAKRIISSHLAEKETLNSNTAYSLNIAISSVDKVELISISSINYLEADGKYTIFHLADQKTKISCKNLGEYEKRLDSKIFFRIHHRYLINITKIISIHKTDGNYCELQNGKTLAIAKRRLDSFYKFLKLN